MAQAEMMDPIQILEKIRIGFAKRRCETLEDAGRALVWHVLNNAIDHLDGRLPVIHRSQIGLLQSFAINQDYPSSVEAEDVA
jgi:hypothetical protein